MLTFLDVEATGLHRGSLPVEIGLARLDLATFDVEAWSRVVRIPDVERVHFDPGAMTLTGITREMVEAEGVSPGEVVSEMRAFLGAHLELISDAAELDSGWLDKLFAMARNEGGRVLDVTVLPLEAVSRTAPGPAIDALPEILRHQSKPHRAGLDAAALARLVGRLLRAQGVRSHVEP